LIQTLETKRLTALPLARTRMLYYSDSKDKKMTMSQEREEPEEEVEEEAVEVKEDLEEVKLVVPEVADNNN